MRIVYKFTIALIIILITFVIAEFLYNLPSHSFNAFRYYTLYGGGERCIRKLEEQTKDFVSLGTFERGHCRVKNAVRISSFNNTELSGDLTLSCPTAVMSNYVLRGTLCFEIIFNGLRYTLGCTVSHDNLDMSFL